MTVLTVGDAKPPVPVKDAPYLTGAFTSNPTTEWDAWLVDSGRATRDVFRARTPAGA